MVETAAASAVATSVRPVMAERFPLVWRFAFYRPRDSAPWAVVSLRFGSKLLDLQPQPPQP